MKNTFTLLTLKKWNRHLVFMIAFVISLLFLNLPVFSQITATTPASRCGAGPVVLHATKATGTIKWYTVPFYGTAIATGTSDEGTLSADGTTFTTKSLSVTKTYYVDAVDANNCSVNANNARIPVIASINANSIQASIIYESATFCKSVTSGQLPILTGNAGGTYTSVRTSSGAGALSLDATTGAILPSSSAEGEYQVTYTVTAAAGCVENPATTNIVITTAPITPTILYSGSPFCTSANTVSVNQNGASGGRYSATPSGLTIDSSNGAITPASSLSGTYTVSYFVAGAGGCAPQTATTTVTMLQLPTAAISYSTSAHSYFTKNQGVQSVNLTGTGAYNGGVYSSTSGLTIDATTGVITPSTSTAGDYTVSYTLAAVSPCAAPAVAATSVTIYPLPTASIAASTDNVCQHASEPTVTFTGASGRTPYTFTYKVNNGDDQMITTTSGNSVAVAQPTAISGSFEYTLVRVADANGSTQGQTGSTTISVNVLPSASFTYSGTPYCSSGSNPTPTLLDGGVSGTFSVAEADAAKLIFVSATTGEIDLTRSVAGTYTVTNTVTAPAGCSTVSAIASVTITKLPIAGFSYQAITYCQNAETSPMPTFAEGAVAGTFTSVPAGVRFDHTTPGKIDLANSTPGTYQIVNTIVSSGGCADVVATVNNFQIVATPVTPVIAYSGTPYCNTITEAQPVELTGSTGGTFTSTRTSSGEGTLSIDPETGTITPSTSTPGVYHITYTVGVGDCTTTAETNVTIYESPVVTNNSTYAICSGRNTDITLAASIPSSFRWTLGEVSSNILDASAGSGSNINQVLSNISYTEPGTVKYVVIPTSNVDPNSCAGAPFTITVTVNPNPQLVINEPAAVCSPATVDLTADAVTEGSTASLTLSYWTNYEATTALSNPSAITTSGTYFIKGTTASGCSVVREVSVTVNPLPAAPTTEVVTVTYDGQPHTATAAAPSGATVVYYTLVTGGEMVSAPSATNAGTYTAWAESKADLTPTQCVSESRTEVKLVINKAPTTTVVTINEGPFTYTGSAITPATVSVMGAGGLSLTPDATYLNNTNAGTATASYTYSETENYLGSSDSKTYTIGKATITELAITGITIPATGATPVYTANNTQFTASVSWSGSPETFASGTVYTATITINPTSNYTLTGVNENTFTVAGATSVSHSAGSGVVTAVFPGTVPDAPGGASSQLFCSGSSIADLKSAQTGIAIKVYSGLTGANELTTGNDLLTTDTHYFVTQTVNSIESTPRKDVTVTINPLPQGSLSANGPFTCTGAGMLTWTATTGTGPYTIVYNDGTSNHTASGVVSGTPFATFITPVTGTTTYTLVSVQDANCTRSSGFTGESATITVTAPTITTSGTIAPVCYSSDAQTTTLAYTATTSSPTSYSIDWRDGQIASQNSTNFAFNASGGTLTGIVISAGTGPGTYDGWITIKDANNCTYTKEVSISVKEVTAAPVITSPINNTATSVSGTSEANASVIVYKAGTTQIGTATADGLGTWTATVSGLATNDVVTAKATAAPDKCISYASTGITVIPSQTAAPTVDNPLVRLEELSMGYITNNDDAIVDIFIYKNHSADYISAITNVGPGGKGGFYLKNFLLLNGDIITAKAKASGKSISNISNDGVAQIPAATKYLVTSSNYNPVAGTSVTITAQLVSDGNLTIPIAGLTVTWSTANANGFSPQTTTSTTDVNGIATVIFTTPSTQGAPNVITATDGSNRTGSSSQITTQ